MDGLDSRQAKSISVLLFSSKPIVLPETDAGCTNTVNIHPRLSLSVDLKVTEIMVGLSKLTKHSQLHVAFSQGLSNRVVVFRLCLRELY